MRRGVLRGAPLLAAAPYLLLIDASLPAIVAAVTACLGVAVVSAAIEGWVRREGVTDHSILFAAVSTWVWVGTVGLGATVQHQYLTALWAGGGPASALAEVSVALPWRLFVSIWIAGTVCTTLVVVTATSGVEERRRTRLRLWVLLGQTAWVALAVALFVLFLVGAGWRFISLETVLQLGLVAGSATLALTVVSAVPVVAGWTARLDRLEVWLFPPRW